MSDLLEELLKLSPAERIQLAEDLWDSVAASPEDLPPLSAEQQAEMERRIKQLEDDPGSALSWEEVRTSLWSRLG
jgi:putative addiction module component (TIGR02574 family)